MSAKSVFRLTAQSPKYNRDRIMNTSFPQRPVIGHDDSVFMGLDSSMAIRNSPQLLWQSLTPELRAEALRRAHLIHLLRQVNPNLQLCRKSLPSPSIPITAEKGVQVPDIRYEFANNNRRFSNRPDIKKNASFTAPGVRIQPRPQQPLSPINSTMPSINTRAPPNVLKSNTSLNIPHQRTAPDRAPYSARESTLQVTLKTVPNTEVKKQTERKDERTNEDVGHKEDEIRDKKATEKDEENVVVVEEENKTSEKTERQVVVKNKEASSGDEDSVVVVLNQPRSEQGLERKYGQFFCRRCLRGWSSRSVWCVRHTCKVYIKQTCNMCNKLVNPYLVCRLPPISSTRKDRK